MMNEQTRQKLNQLKLVAMVAAWQHQQEDANASSLAFDDRFGLIVDAEYLARDNRRTQRLLKDAQLRLPEASIENLEIAATRGLERAQIAQLSTCTWVNEHLGVLISGATGVGKSYLGCALGHTACRRGFRVLYRRVPRLFEELGLAKADGTYTRALAKLARFDVLILDDLGVGTLKESQRHDLLEVLEDRYGRRSTIVTSQLPIAKWHEWVGDPTLADAIMDRLVHNAYKLTLVGPSRRKESTKEKKKENG